MNAIMGQPMHTKRFWDTLKLLTCDTGTADRVIIHILKMSNVPHSNKY